MIEFFLDKIGSNPDNEAIVSSEFSLTCGELRALTEKCTLWLAEKSIPAGAVVSFDGDYSPSALALFLALVRNKNIVVPLSLDSRQNFEEFRDIASTEYDISISGLELELKVTGRQASEELYKTLTKKGTPGLVLFSSGSTGKSKAIVQDLNKLMEKFKTPRKALRMLIFLQLDHIGGVNSLLYSLANNGTVIVAAGRTPEKVCQSIEQFKGEVLPTSPSFLNLLILSKAYESYDLSSLKLMTYGTEPMQTSTLKRLSG